MSETLHKSVQDLFFSKRLTFIAGPCVIESYDLCATLAEKLAEQTAKAGVGYIFKASFDKANRTSIHGFRGPGIDEGLATLERVKKATGVPILTDIHECAQAQIAASVVDVLQIPAFLCRQTDLLIAAAKTGRPTNIKKGQFLAPKDMVNAVQKFQESNGGPVTVTERGVSFGYNNLVVDMRALPILAATTKVPVVFDATHSVQLPGGAGTSSSGDRQFAVVLARAAAAVGVQGIFCEVHPDPDKALSDGPNSLTLALFAQMLHEVVAIDHVRQSFA